MSLSRFYLAPDQWSDPGSLWLGEEEAHHCTRVLRKRAGDEVELFDGRGRVALARIIAARKEVVELQRESETRHAPLAHEVHVLPALIKGEAFEWLLEKAVELGAASVRPVITANSVVQWDGAQAEKKMAKWRRHMLEAAKQCHTPFLPELQEPVTLAEALTDTDPETLRLVPALFGEVKPLVTAVKDWGTRQRRAQMLIGPEGDFLPDELQAAIAAGYQPVTLGPLILRAETAVVATLAFLTQSWVEA
jgi:16S rRNA (uracil1498-N3)-methyltransferase